MRDTQDDLARLDHWRKHVLCSADFDLIEDAAEDLEREDREEAEKANDVAQGGFASAPESFLTWRSALCLLDQALGLLPYDRANAIRDAGRRLLEDLFSRSDPPWPDEISDLLAKFITGELECA